MTLACEEKVIIFFILVTVAAGQQQAQIGFFFLGIIPAYISQFCQIISL